LVSKKKCEHKDANEILPIGTKFEVFFEGDNKWHVATVKEIKKNGVTRIWYEEEMTKSCGVFLLLYHS
jgi:hypothetical protein